MTTYKSPVFFIPAQGHLVPTVIDVATRRVDAVYVGLYSQKTLDELRVQYPLIAIGESDAVRDAKELMLKTPPKEITADAFQRALCCLPPEGYKANSIGTSFKCEEYLSGRITAIYAFTIGRYWTFNDVASLPHAAVMAKVLKVIEAEEATT